MTLFIRRFQTWNHTDCLLLLTQLLFSDSLNSTPSSWGWNSLSIPSAAYNLGAESKLLGWAPLRAGGEGLAPPGSDFCPVSQTSLLSGDESATEGPVPLQHCREELGDLPRPAPLSGAPDKCTPAPTKAGKHCTPSPKKPREEWGGKCFPIKTFRCVTPKGT